ncbi:RimJ/RimL family protein N-acetyltransferase [Bradyrhizobium sp. GM2.4]
MITCQTERLVLTSMRPEHEAELFKLHNDPLVLEVVFKNVAQTVADVRKTLDWALDQWHRNGFGLWMVYEKGDNGPILVGRCGLGEYDGTKLEYINAFSERGVGRGLGAESARFAISHALQISTKEKVVGFIAPENVRAQRAAKKLGLRYIDDRPYKYDGRVRQYYELTREEYFNQQYYPGKTVDRISVTDRLNCASLHR